MVDYARALEHFGAEIVVITGRHKRVNGATRSVLNRIGFGNVRLFERESAIFDLQRAVGEKTRALLAVKPLYFVGDREDLDGAAARAANVPFVHVDAIKEFRLVKV
jgi:hypothetical protein